MLFKRGSTPTLIFRLKEEWRQQVDLTLANHVYVTLEQGKKELRKKDEELELTSDTITVSYSQEDTLFFKKGTILIEVNVTFDEGGRAISETLEDEVIESVEDRVLE